jgi:hypothetical protein
MESLFAACLNGLLQQNRHFSDVWFKPTADIFGHLGARLFDADSDPLGMNSFSGPPAMPPNG